MNRNRIYILFTLFTNGRKILTKTYQYFINDFSSLQNSILCKDLAQSFDDMQNDKEYLFPLFHCCNWHRQKYSNICDTLRDFRSVTIWRLHGRSSASECMLTLCSTFISILSICMSQHGTQTSLSNVKRLNAFQMGKHQQSNDV